VLVAVEDGRIVVLVPSASTPVGAAARGADVGELLQQDLRRLGNAGRW